MKVLSSCLHGGMQNQNECFNALIWQHAPKETHSGLPIVELATFLALSHFNNGLTSIMHVLEELHLEPGVQTNRACANLDNMWLHKYSECMLENQVWTDLRIQFVSRNNK